MNVSWTAYASPNISGMLDTFTYINSTSDNLFGLSLVFSLWAIMFLVFSKFGVTKALGASSFVIFAVSLPLRGMGVIQDLVLLLPAIGVIISFFWWNSDR